MFSPRRQSVAAISTAIVFHLVILFFRWGVVQSADDSLVADPDAYRHLAVQWAKHGVYGSIWSEDAHVLLPTAYRPPMYPWVLSWLVDSKGELNVRAVAWLHALLGASTCLATFLVARHWLKSLQPLISTRNGLIASYTASGLVALDPILLRQSQLVMTETLATAITAWTWWSLVGLQSLGSWNGSKRALISGLLFGVGVLCRPASVVWFLATLLISVVVVPFPRKAAFACFLVLGGSIAVIPWGIRNWILMDQFLVTTTHGGYTLYLANNDSLYDHFATSWSRDWNADSFFDNVRMELKGSTSEFEQDRLANSQALKVMWRRPVSFVSSCLLREGWLWALWPHQSSSLTRAAIGCWYGTTYASAIFGFVLLVQHRKHCPRSMAWVWAVGMALVASISVLHAVYWSNMRMRSVCVPTLSLLAIIPIAFLKASLSKPTIRSAGLEPTDRIQS